MRNILIVGCKQLSWFEELSNYKELFLHALEENNPQTNTPMPHMMHQNPIE
jgi:hypothetical protein